MNVNDTQAVEVKGDRLKAIFDQQHALAEKYVPIEKRNGLRICDQFPVNLHDGRGQLQLKDFAWRAVEEIAEAVDAALEKGWQSTHAREEIADALHFITEMALTSGITFKDLVDYYDLPDAETDMLDHIYTLRKLEHAFGVPKPMFSRPGINESIVKFLRGLGMTCHTLKNKPWKSNQMLTDENEYRTRMMEVFGLFIDLCLSIDMTAQELTDLYFRKAQVNEFRQRSNY